MKQSYFTDVAVRKYTFKTIRLGFRPFALLRGESALLAVANRQLAHGFAISRGESALFRKQDCFECLPPHNKVPGRTKCVRPASIA